MSTLTLFLPILLLLSQEADAEKLLTRSFYLPVRFSTCEHVSDALLYASDREGNEKNLLARLPSKRTFQFTYYPTLKEIRPELSVVKVVLTGKDYQTFQFITLTADAIYLSKEKKMELDKDGKIARKLKYKTDVRYDTANVNIQCDKFPHE